MTTNPFYINKSLGVDTVPQVGKEAVKRNKAGQHHSLLCRPQVHPQSMRKSLWN